jgi:hypothetical protein
MLVLARYHTTHACIQAVICQLCRWSLRSNQTTISSSIFQIPITRLASCHGQKAADRCFISWCARIDRDGGGKRACQPRIGSLSRVKLFAMCAMCFLRRMQGKPKRKRRLFFTCRTQSRGEQDAVAYCNGKNGCGRPRTCDRPGVLYVRVVVSCPRGA